ncbi:MAG: type IV pilus secretin PilQ family protein [Psychromonas sp.]
MKARYKNKLASFFSIAGLLFGSSLALAESQLTKLNINSLSVGKLELKFEFNEAISGYEDKLHYRPNQLIVDIEGARSILKINPIKINKSGINKVKTERTVDGLRLVISLTVLMPYRIKQEGNILFVRFGEHRTIMSATSDDEKALATAIGQNSGSQTTVTPLAIMAADKKVTLQSTQSYVNRIHGIDFKRGSEGQGKLLIYLENASVAVDIHRRGKQLIAVFQSTQIADEFLYIMDVGDFATSVQTIETFKEDGATRFVLDVKDGYHYRYNQLGTLFIIEVSKKLKNKKEGEYQGKAISLNFQDIPVRTVLQLIADFNDLNIVMTDSVSGNITLRLDDIPWEQALDIILKIKGLGKRMDGNVLMILPAVELANKKREQLELLSKIEEFAPLFSEFIQINYAKAADIAAMLSGENASLLSSRGKVSTDQRTNTLLLKDTVAVIDAVKEMLIVLDVPVRQVVIEARMVTVSDSVGEELGVSWGLTSTGRNVSTSGTLEGIENNASLDDRLNVNLPIVDAAGTIAFRVANIVDGALLDLELSALESENKAEIIASPRITTANQQTAYIEQGSEIPYTESSSSGATTVSFKKAVLSLEVTPQITPDNKIILDLVITQNSIGETVSTGTGSAVAINTQEIKTQVLVNHGETVVLGGIYQETTNTDISKVPFLGDIPYLGALFSTRSDSTSKSELLIFVTPRIIMQTEY